ncbi:hypothetical protein RB601_006937 [Gaeumannomyces tritici]
MQQRLCHQGCYICKLQKSHQSGFTIPVTEGEVSLAFGIFRNTNTDKMADTEQLARGYVSNNNTQSDAGLFLLDRLNVAPGMHVLDVGCGPGNLTAHMVTLVGESGRVVGIDPSPERIKLARETYAAAAAAAASSSSNLAFHEGRAEDLSRFGDASFDAVFVNSTFHWIADQALAVREFARVLRPGGRLGVSGGSGDFVALHERIKADVLAREPYAAYPDGGAAGGPRFVKRREMEGLLDDAGFAGHEIVVNRIVKTARDGAAMVEWLDTSSSGKTYGGIPLELRPMAREEMIREWDKVTTEDGIRMDMELLVTVATR